MSNGRLTKEDIDKVIQQISSISDFPKNDLFDNPFRHDFLGIPITVNPYAEDLEPVIQLSQDLPVSDEFREKCNDWYIKMFGYKNPVIYMWNRTMFGGTGVIAGKNVIRLFTEGTLA